MHCDCSGIQVPRTQPRKNNGRNNQNVHVARQHAADHGSGQRLRFRHRLQRAVLGSSGLNGLTAAGALRALQRM